MNLYIFFQTFYLVFLILISVGPGFLTIANIAMTRGYKTSSIAVCGCFVGDCILLTIGAFCAQEAVKALSKNVLVCLSFLSVFLLLCLAVKFWKLDIKNLKTKSFNKKNGFSLAITLFCLKMSSPICIVGYGMIFTNIISSSDIGTLLSACFGGYVASIVVNVIMVSTWGIIGEKINIKILLIINKLSSIFIGSFAIFILANTCKELFFKH